MRESANSVSGTLLMVEPTVTPPLRSESAESGRGDADPEKGHTSSVSHGRHESNPGSGA